VLAKLVPVAEWYGRASWVGGKRATQRGGQFVHKPDLVWRCSFAIPEVYLGQPRFNTGDIGDLHISFLRGFISRRNFDLAQLS